MNDFADSKFDRKNYLIIVLSELDLFSLFSFPEVIQKILYPPDFCTVQFG